MGILIFGIIWTTMSFIMLLGLYTGINEVTINGGTMLQTELNDMLTAKVFVGIFLFVGLVLVFVGARQILRAITIHQKGTKTYGYIENIFSANLTVNGIPFYHANVLIMNESGRIEKCTTEKSFPSGQFNFEEFVKLIHYEGKVIIKERANDHEVPYELKNKIENSDLVFRNGDFERYDAHTDTNDEKFIDSGKYNENNDFEF